MHNFPRPTKEMLEQYSPYPVIFVHDISNEVICESCAKELSNSTDEIELKDNNIFTDYIYNVYYEGDSIFCDRCNREIESAYGNPDNEE